MLTNIRKKVSVVLLGAVALGGCDILDVENPNNLVEESINNTAAAAAVVNGAEALVYSAISQMWEPYLVATDELTWIGSRDAWLELNQGAIGNNANEFTDARFESLGEARWFADEAISIIEGHINEGRDIDNPQVLLGRANLYAGLIYTIIGEIQQDFAFSDKQDAAPPVGAAAMPGVFDTGIGYLTDAIAAAQAAGDAQLEYNATAMRARARHSRAVRGNIQPTIAANPLVDDAGASSDATAALAILAANANVSGNYQATFSSATITNTMASNINSRKENNIDPSLVTITDNDAPGGITVVLQDPIDAVADPVVTSRVTAFRVDGENWRPLDIATAELMNLILAEAALAQGNSPNFATFINATRGGTAFSGQIAEQAMLEHARRVNTLFMGLRLADMYRFGISDPNWLPTATTVTSPGELLPITQVEILSNCHLNGAGCGG